MNPLGCPSSKSLRYCVDSKQIQTQRCHQKFNICNHVPQFRVRLTTKHGHCNAIVPILTDQFN